VYPALQRMLIKGWVKAGGGLFCGVTAESRRAATTADAEGRKQLEVDEGAIRPRDLKAIARVIQTAPS